MIFTSPSPQAETLVVSRSQKMWAQVSYISLDLHREVDRIRSGPQSTSVGRGQKGRSSKGTSRFCSFILGKCGDFPGGSVIKNPPANAEDARVTGSIPGSGRSPGERHGNPLQYSCLESPMDRGVWRATAYGVTKSWT